MKVKEVLSGLHLDTVCRSAKCPNMGECWSQGTATFMIMGSICTRDCRFCATRSGTPFPLETDEPERVAEAAKLLKLSYVVVTSVTRDDLVDGGARHFFRTIEAVRHLLPDCSVEALIPGFQGSLHSISQVVAAAPTVLNHNLETVPRLYPSIRFGADYYRSLRLLKAVKEFEKKMITKSGLMLGLGEERHEIVQTMADLLDVGCDMLTLGQYIRPSSEHAPERRFLHPEEFEDLQSTGRDMGFSAVVAGPFVRSSYHAEHFAKKLLNTPGVDEQGEIFQVATRI